MCHVVAKGIIIGMIGVAIVAAVILMYTNAAEVLKPEIETAADKAKDAVSQIEGKEVVKKAEEVSEKVKNVTEKIKVTNPLEPKK